MTRWLRVLIACTCVALILGAAAVSYALWGIRVDTHNAKCVAAWDAQLHNLQVEMALPGQQPPTFVPYSAQNDATALTVAYLRKASQGIAKCYNG